MLAAVWDHLPLIVVATVLLIGIAYVFRQTSDLRSRVDSLALSHHQAPPPSSPVMDPAHLTTAHYDDDAEEALLDDGAQDDAPGGPASS